MAVNIHSSIMLGPRGRSHLFYNLQNYNLLYCMTRKTKHENHKNAFSIRSHWKIILCCYEFSTWHVESKWLMVITIPIYCMLLVWTTGIDISYIIAKWLKTNCLATVLTINNSWKFTAQKEILLVCSYLLRGSYLQENVRFL